MRRFQNLIIGVFAFAAISLMLCDIARSQTGDIVGVDEKQGNTQRVNLGGFGSVELPEGFLAFRSQNWVDAWFGYIRSTDGEFRVSYGIGMGQSPFETQSENIELMDPTSFPEPVIKVGRRWETKGRTLFVAVPSAYFSAHILNDEQEKLFFEILATYEVARCRKCRSAMSSTADKLEKDGKP